MVIYIFPWPKGVIKTLARFLHVVSKSEKNSKLLTQEDFFEKIVNSLRVKQMSNFMVWNLSVNLKATSTDERLTIDFRGDKSLDKI